MTEFFKGVAFFFAILSVTVVISLAAINWTPRSTPADPWDCQPTTIIERPVTDAELVVGLAELSTDLNAQLKAARAETANIKAQALMIINALQNEVIRLREKAGENGTRVVPPNDLPVRPPMPCAT